MLADTRAFSSFSVDDLEAARRFYGDVLGLELSEQREMGVLAVQLAGSCELLIYEKPDHQPASFTVLNFAVHDIDGAVDELADRGVRLEHYEGFEQDDRGIARPPDPMHGPPIAWFTDPAGNILAVLEERR